MTMRNKYTTDGEVTVIHAISKGVSYGIVIDTEDLGRLLSLGITWCVANNGSSLWYVKNTSKKLYLHRFLMNAMEGYEVDHINQDTLDNRKSNLRVVTSGQNKMNRHELPSNNTSGVRGVSWNKRYMKWRARVVIQGTEHHVGFFDDIDHAKDAIEEFRASYVGLSPENRISGSPLRDVSERNGRPQRTVLTEGTTGVIWDKKKENWKVYLSGVLIYRCVILSEAVKVISQYIKE